MNSSHLGKGSQCPPLMEEIRIYNMRFCPYGERALLVAVAKQIPHDIVNCNLTEKAEWLLERNPNGKVPTIEFRDSKVLYESLIVADYLDEIYPNRPLTSKDPFQKARDKIWIEEFNKVITLHYKCLSAIKQNDKNALKEHLQNLQKELVPFEQELSTRGTTFFAGDDCPGMLDYMIWPWIERGPVIKLSTPIEIFDFDCAKKDNPKLENWRKAMKEDPTVKKIILSPEAHKQFIESHFTGSPNYNLIN